MTELLVATSSEELPAMISFLVANKISETYAPVYEGGYHQLYTPYTSMCGLHFTCINRYSGCGRLDNIELISSNNNYFGH